MSRQIQIPEALFVDLCRFHILEQQDGETAKRISNGLNKKLDALARRDLYTKYKTSDDPAEREKARLSYLEKAGISGDFRSL